MSRNRSGYLETRKSSSVGSAILSSITVIDNAPPHFPPFDLLAVPAYDPNPPPRDVLSSRRCRQRMRQSGCRLLAKSRRNMSPVRDIDGSSASSAYALHLDRHNVRSANFMKCQNACTVAAITLTTIKPHQSRTIGVPDAFCGPEGSMPTGRGHRLVYPFLSSNVVLEWRRLRTRSREREQGTSSRSLHLEVGSPGEMGNREARRNASSGPFGPQAESARTLVVDKVARPLQYGRSKSGTPWPPQGIRPTPDLSRDAQRHKPATYGHLGAGIRIPRSPF